MRTKTIFASVFLFVVISILATVATTSAACVQGQIEDAATNAAIENVNVILIEFMENEQSIETVLTSVEGSYVVCPIEAGVKQLLVWGYNYSPKRETFEIDDENVTLNFELDAAASVTGRILNSSEDPVTGAHLSLDYSESIGFPLIVATAGGAHDSLTDGQYVINNVEVNRTMQLTVTHPDYVTYVSEPLTLEAAQSLVKDITLTEN